MYYTDPSRLDLTNARKFVDYQSQNTSDSECFDAAIQQIWVHLWGPCVMGLYYVIIIITISKKRILIDWIFHFHRCQMTLLRNEMEPFYRAWFSCCPSGRIPSDDYGIPTCSSNDVTRTAALGLPKQQDVENQMRTHAQNGENACLLKPHEHR